MFIASSFFKLVVGCQFLYIATEFMSHKATSLSCWLVQHPSSEKDSRQAGMTDNSAIIMSLCIEIQHNYISRRGHCLHSNFLLSYFPLLYYFPYRRVHEQMINSNSLFLSKSLRYRR